MRKWCVLLMVLALLLTAVTWADGGQKGSLVIVGGALRADNDPVYEAFIERAGGVTHAKFAIVPAASGSPHKYATLFKEDLMARGITEAQIITLPLAVKDDKKSDVDESLWAENGSNPDVAALLDGVTGVWFVGGDQMRITEVLLKPDGSNTLVLDAIWEVYKKGGVIGGTSAGAAIMSDVMIAGGDSFGALFHGHAEAFDQSTLDYQNQGGLVVSKGLGFFKPGIVDQHFDRKGRLGRLVVVAYENQKDQPIAYGVEENTAMIYDRATGKVSAAGQNGVVIVDVKNAARLVGGGYQGIEVSYIEPGDQYDIPSDTFEMNKDKYTTIGYEYMYTENPLVSGAISANQTLKNMIAFDLVDNEAASSVPTYLLDAKGNGYVFTFSKIDQTEGYWGQNGAADLYSFERVGLVIEPITFKIDAKQSVETSSKKANPPITHVVKSGEVLWKIAKNYKVSLDALIKSNHITRPNLIKVNQVLVIPE